MGPGETAQGVALAQTAREAGIECKFVITDIVSANWVVNKGFKQIVAIGSKPKRVTRYIDQGYNPEQIVKIIEIQKPNVLILCNSKAYSWGFIKRPPKPRPLIVSLDSNWLFGQYQDVKMPEWIDKFLVIFPEKIFRAGLKKYGGYYEIKEKYLRKIIPVGFIPSYKKVSPETKKKIRAKYSIRKDEKLVFAYMGTGITYRNTLLNKIFTALEILKNKGYKFKLIYTADRKINKPWAIFAKQFLSHPDNFSKVLGSSDLVISHQGLTTLFQAIRNRVPIISNIPPKGKYHSGKYHTSFYEIKTFEKLGLCRAVFRNLPYTYLMKEVKNLFDNKKIVNEMKENQEKIFKPGEKTALEKILNLQKEHEKT
ncbi:hypothetical protein J7J18_00935 [bacterium]|nr:hypothetical protein [bacterium]